MDPHLTRQPGDPLTGWITPDDVQAAIDAAVNKLHGEIAAANAEIVKLRGEIQTMIDDSTAIADAFLPHQWKPGTYNRGEVVFHKGRLWVQIDDPSSSAEPDEHTEPWQTITFQEIVAATRIFETMLPEPWNPLTRYLVGDHCLYGDDVYVATVVNRNEFPVMNPNWMDVNWE